MDLSYAEINTSYRIFLGLFFKQLRVGVEDMNI
jgi:hypothetical protein